MFKELLDIALVVGAMKYATPVLLAGLGGLFGERSGVVNIGLEGTMLLGAFTAAVTTHYAGSPWIGLAAAVCVSTFISLLHAYCSIALKVDQIISGLAVNILAANLSVYLLVYLFDTKGKSPAVEPLPNVTIPWLGDLPVIGQLFGNQSLLTILAFVATIAVYFVLYRTRFGLHVFAAGENPQAAHVLGIKVNAVRYRSVAIGGVACGLAGAFLSISFLNFFSQNMTAGMGYIALAAIIFGRWNPIGVCLASLFFGLTNAIQIRIQGEGLIPTEFVQILPYLLTILMVAGTFGKTLPPAASGKRFDSQS